MDYYYIDESLENEINNLELPDEINRKIDKDYEIDLADDEIITKELEKELDLNGIDIDYQNKSKNVTRKQNYKNNNKIIPKDDFELYIKDLDKKIEEEILQENLDKNKLELNANTNAQNSAFSHINNVTRANKVIETDAAIRNAIEGKMISFEELVDYIDYYELFTFINKSQKFSIEQFSKISDLCGKETFEESEEDIKNRIENTLKITDNILDKDNFDVQQLFALHENKQLYDQRAQDDRKKRQEKEFLLEKLDAEKENYLLDLIQIQRDRHIDLAEIYRNISEQQILNNNLEDGIALEENTDNISNVNAYLQNTGSNYDDNSNSNGIIMNNKNERKKIQAVNNIINEKEAEELLEQDKEYKFLEKLYQNEKFSQNLNRKENKKADTKSGRLFFVEKDLQDLENLKKGKITNLDDINQAFNPISNITALEEALILNVNNDNFINYNEQTADEAEENYKLLLKDLYKKHGLSYAENNKSAKSERNINNKKIPVENNILNKLNDRNNRTTSEGFEATSSLSSKPLNIQKRSRSKKVVPPLIKNGKIILPYGNNYNNNNVSNQTSIKNPLVNNKQSNQINRADSQPSDASSSLGMTKKDNNENILKESFSSKMSFRSKFSNSSNLNNSNKSSAPLKNIDLFTTDNKMMNLVKMRDQRKEYLKNKIGNKSNKRPDLFAFSTQHIVINDKEQDGVQQIFDIIQDATNKNSSTKFNSSHHSNFDLEKSTDSLSSRKSSVRKKIEEAINFSKNKIY